MKVIKCLKQLHKYYLAPEETKNIAHMGIWWQKSHEDH